jgi:hypothetical protein
MMSEDEMNDAIAKAYIAGATDVHNNYQEDRDPDFAEAAHDYVASIDPFEGLGLAAKE